MGFKIQQLQHTASRCMACIPSRRLAVLAPFIAGLAVSTGLSAAGQADRPRAATLVPTTAASAAQHAAQRNVAQEEANRALVVGFYEQFFNQKNLAAADVIEDGYIQHNPLVPTGKAAFVDFFTGYFKNFPNHQIKIVRSAADGDLVYLHVHSIRAPGERGNAIVDIFRVKDGRIVEHWDVVQAVPEQAANDNTMF